MKQQLILASKSSIRRTLLDNAGIPYRAISSNVDESEIKTAFHGDAERLALTLAEEKARCVAKSLDGSVSKQTLILGADQLLRCDDKLYDKAKNETEAIKRLILLQDRWHELIGGYVLLKEGKIAWKNVSLSRLKMRAMSPNVIEQYISANGPKILGSVGCYQIESFGVQLFERIEGDLFSVQGLDLFSLMTALEEMGWQLPVSGDHPS